MNDIDDLTIQEAAKGDRQAFESVYKATSKFVYSVIFRMVHNRQEAEEITQDVYIKVYKYLPQFERRSSFKTWLYRIAYNTTLDNRKKKSNFRTESLDAEVLPDRVAHVSSNVHSHMHQKDSESKLQELLSHLTEDQRMCIILREIQGLHYDEIAKVLNLNLNTVRSRLKRAREAMLLHAKRGAISHEL